MNNTLRFGIIPLAALVVFMTACDNGADNGEGEETQPGVISVKVTPNPYIVHRGHEQTFFVSVSNTNDKAVTWSIEGDGLRGNTTINQNGLLSVSPDEEQTTLTIKAALVADQDIYGTAAVSIPAPIITGVEISLSDGIVISPWYPTNKAIDVDSGKTEQFLAKVVGQNFPKQDITWTITGGASGTSITDGLLTVSSAAPQNSTFTVQAASTVDPAMVDTITVTVRPPTINTFRVVPNDINITPFDPVEFTITVLGSGNIQGLYEIERTVERSDDPPNAIATERDIPYKDTDEQGNPITVMIHDKGTRFEGNVLYMSPFEYWGDLDDNDEVFTPIEPFFFDVTITVTSETLNFSPSVQKYEVQLTPDHGIVESTDVSMKEFF